MQNYLVRGSALEGIRATIDSLGGDGESVLHQAGLLQAERDPQCWISYHRFLLLLEEGVRATQCPHFGLMLSYQQGINILGPVGFVIRQAPDLRSAMRQLTIHFAHHNQGADVSIKVENGIALWGFSCKLEGGAPVRQQLDLVTGIGVNLIRLLYQPEWNPKAVYFPHSRPDNIRPYRELFRCPINFDADQLLMTFDAAILDTPLSNADPQLHKLLDQHLNEMRLLYPDDYCGQVRHLINQALTTGDCSIERVASHLAVGKRTLQRQLRSHNTRYQDLLEEVRFNIAKRYLRESNGSLTALADMLCYSDLSTFSTAFRHYHGVSPRDWRKHASTGLTSPA
jgi:AraC-like DNA-binding protein